MIVDYHQLNQMVTPIATAVTDEVSLLKQNATPGTWHAVIVMADTFFLKLVSLDQTTKSSLLSTRKASSVLSLS